MGRRGARSNGGHPVAVVDEHRPEIPDDVDDPENLHRVHIV